MTRALFLMCCTLTATAGVTLALSLAAPGSAAAQNVTLSPAVVPLSGRAGQSTSRQFTLSNATDQPLSFTLVAKDVVVRNGQRVFVEAGELRGSVAATVVFSTRAITVEPRGQRAVDARLTLPSNMTTRAVVILFQGTTRVGGNATVALGSLLTFDVTGRVSVATGELQVTPPTASANATMTVPVTNDGSEPAVVRGAVAIVAGSGALVGRTALAQRRLLPGERTALSSDYPGELPSGSYRVIATIEGANQAWTRVTELTIP